MKFKFFLTIILLVFAKVFVFAQTREQPFHLQKAMNDTIHRSDIKKSLELLSDNPSVKVASFNIDVKYTSFLFTENSTTNKITKGMVDIIKNLNGSNNFFMINKIVVMDGGTTVTHDGFKIYVID